MGKFPLSRYKFIITDNQVIAISTYAGKTVKGIAKVNPLDKMDVEFGKKLAAARCNAKVAKRRAKRANEKLLIAQKMVKEATTFFYKMNEYYIDSSYKYDKAMEDVHELLKSVN